MNSGNVFILLIETIFLHLTFCKFESRSRWGVLDTTLCDKVCQGLVVGLWFSPVSSINKTDRHDITEILLKVALYNMTLTPLRNIYALSNVRGLTPLSCRPEILLIEENWVQKNPTPTCHKRLLILTVYRVHASSRSSLSGST